MVKGLAVAGQDTLTLLAFKWRSLRPTSQKAWLFGVVLFAFTVIIIAAAAGPALRILVSPPQQASESVDMGRTVLVWLQVFLRDNAATTMGGVLWAYTMSLVISPLIGYSFSSLMPDGDLEGVQVTERHKITDSLFLQFLSPVSFLQLVTLTALTSILAIGNAVPGIAVVFSWGVWAVGIFATVFFAWLFEYLLRRWGAKTKWQVGGTLLVLLGVAYLINPDAFINFYGLGGAYVDLATSPLMSFSTFWLPAAIGSIMIVISALLVVAIWRMGLLTLAQYPRAKKVSKVAVGLAKLGLAEKVTVSGLAGFFGRVVVRHGNIFKPLLVAAFFTSGLATVFYLLYGSLIAVAVLIPTMVSLAWGVNVFGILGSGVSWLLTLPEVKQKSLRAAGMVQMMLCLGLGLLVLAVVSFQVPSVDTIVSYLLALVTASAVLTSWSIHRSVHEPHRYRVRVRGESILPPNKAFSFMVILFILGFLTAGFVTLAPTFVAFTSLTGGWYVAASVGVQVVVALLVLWLSWASLRQLEERWVTDRELVQHVMKKVGTAN